jgi:hypothetical protein
MSTNKFENATLFMTLREETDVLRKRHQRKGVEYRVKESGRKTFSTRPLGVFEQHYNVMSLQSVLLFQQKALLV